MASTSTPPVAPEETGERAVPEAAAVGAAGATHAVAVTVGRGATAAMLGPAEMQATLACSMSTPIRSKANPRVSVMIASSQPSPTIGSVAHLGCQAKAVQVAAADEEGEHLPSFSIRSQQDHRGAAGTKGELAQKGTDGATSIDIIN